MAKYICMRLASVFVVMLIATVPAVFIHAEDVLISPDDSNQYQQPGQSAEQLSEGQIAAQNAIEVATAADESGNETDPLIIPEWLAADWTEIFVWETVDWNTDDWSEIGNWVPAGWMQGGWEHNTIFE